MSARRERVKQAPRRWHPVAGWGAFVGASERGGSWSLFPSKRCSDASAATRSSAAARAARAGRSKFLSAEKSDVIGAWVRSGEVRWATEEERRRARLAEKWRQHRVREVLRKAEAEVDWEEEGEEEEGEGVLRGRSRGTLASKGNALRRFHTDYALGPQHKALGMEEPTMKEGALYATPSCLPGGPSAPPGDLDQNASKYENDTTKDCWGSKGSSGDSPALEGGRVRALDRAPSSATDAMGSSGDSGEMDGESGPLAYPWPHSGELGTAGESAIVAEAKQGSVTGAAMPGGTGGSREGQGGRDGGSGENMTGATGAVMKGWGRGCGATGAASCIAGEGSSRAQLRHSRAVKGPPEGLEEAPWELPMRGGKSSPCCRPSTAVAQSSRPLTANTLSGHGSHLRGPMQDGQPGILSHRRWLGLVWGRPSTASGRHPETGATRDCAQRLHAGQCSGRQQRGLQRLQRTWTCDEGARVTRDSGSSTRKGTEDANARGKGRQGSIRAASSAEPRPCNQRERSLTTTSANMEGAWGRMRQGQPGQAHGCGLPKDAPEAVATCDPPPQRQGSTGRPHVWWLGVHLAVPKPGVGRASSVRSTATSDAGDPLWRSGPLARETCAQRDRELLGIIPHCRSTTEWPEAEHGADEAAAFSVQGGAEHRHTSKSKESGLKQEAWAGAEKRAEKEKLRSAEMRRAALRRVHTVHAI